MEFTVNNNNNEIVIKPVGRLDSTTSSEFEEKAVPLITDDIINFVVDMAEVDFISSKGLRVLVTIYKKLNGRKLSVINTNNSVTEVLKLSGMLKIFDVQ